MAALERPSEASYEVHENVKVDTISDHADHTFCGIMFPIQAKCVVPVQRIQIRSVAVRGKLGPLTVWVTKEDVTCGEDRIPTNRAAWTKIYDRVHQPSLAQYDTLDLQQNPIVLTAGQTRGVYIHSSSRGDKAIVYDNSDSRSQRRRYDDDMITIYTGRAHLSSEPFGRTSMWGGRVAWREYREFVGHIQYAVTFKLWNPVCCREFGDSFQRATQTLLACQRRLESPVSRMPDEIIFYILNMCRWDWFEGCHDAARKNRRGGHGRRRQKEQSEKCVEVAKRRSVWEVLFFGRRSSG